MAIMSRPDTQALWEEGHDAIDARLRERIGSRCWVIYSAYPTADDDVPIDNLDEVPIPGLVRFVARRTLYFGGPESRDYEGPVLESPTWLDVCAEANKMIRATRDHTHVFLVDVEVVDRVGDVQVARFRMDS
jgi:hypothetical protein